MSKETAVAFISKQLKDSFDELAKSKFESKQLHDFIVRAISDMKNNPLCGTKVPRGSWPAEYVKRYSITNLWKYNLPNAWRLIYTLETDEIRIVSIILEWFDHKSYERRFGY
jgi:hypothetical protein